MRFALCVITPSYMSAIILDKSWTDRVEHSHVYNIQVYNSCSRVPTAMSRISLA